MHKEHPLLEILPLNEQEMVTVSVYSPGAHPTSPHYHPEYELTLTTGEKIYRIIGDTVQESGETELILLGPNLYHKWEAHIKDAKKTQVIAINFNDNFLLGLDKKNNNLKHILEKSVQGILFSPDKASEVKQRIEAIANLKKRASLKEIADILCDISQTNDYRILCNNSKSNIAIVQDAKMLALTVYLKKNYTKKLLLDDVAANTGKSITSFNRFIRKYTGTTFTNYSNRIRVSFAARNLIETTDNVAHIAKISGFNNLAHFNRIFKTTFGITPLRYRETFYGRRRFI